MTHLLDKWLAASKAGNPTLAASIATLSGQPGQSLISTGLYDPGGSYTGGGAVTILVAEVKAKPIPIRAPAIMPPSIIPPGIQYPTVELVNHEGEGFGMPWTTGPGALQNQEWPLGSILFYQGNRLGVSIGIYDKGESMRDLLVTYHTRASRLRVHTGVGSSKNQGYSAREDPTNGGSTKAIVPYDRPQPPAGGGYGMLDTLKRAEEAAPSINEPWVDIIPGVSTPFKRPTLGQLEDTLRYFAAFGDDFFTWDF